MINPDKPEKAGAHGEETKLAHHDHPMAALCRANIRATELAADRGYIRDHNRHAGVLRGAPTHSGAWLLEALGEDGWKLVKADA